ncbi:MAG: glycosyltransferase family 9 protein [Planctomycetota bacterium]
MTEPNGFPWINPIGGYGDMLMVSGVLKQVIEQDPKRRFNLVRRTKYLTVFTGHPGIATIGYPPKGARVQNVDYWAMEDLGPGEKRPMQVLARAFGLSPPIEERLYFPPGIVEDPLLHGLLPWKEQNVLIAPASDSMRKVMHPSIWHRLVDLLLADGIRVMQLGRSREQHIRNCYSLLGLTSVAQAIALVAKADVVVTSDNFLMHAAWLCGTPAVVIWGPTRHEVYGYPGHVHIQMPKACRLGRWQDCVGPKHNNGGELYGTSCPEGERHCMDQAHPEEIYEGVREALANGRPGA